MKLSRTLRFLAPFLVFTGLCSATDLPTYSVRAERILDGDTGVFVITEGRFAKTRIKVRLAGVDAPELKKGRSKPAQPFALDAKSALEQHTDGRVVRLSVLEMDRKAGVVLGILDYWMLDTRVNVNAEQVRHGYAELVTSAERMPYELRRPLDLASAEAVQSKRGVWSLSGHRPAGETKRLAAD